MTTVLQYLVIATVIGLVLFALALLLFGRGEQLAPLPARTSPAALPERDIGGSDVREVRFALAVRGYRMSDVDWTLERLADELDRTKARLAELEPALTDNAGAAELDSEVAESAASPSSSIDPADLFAGIPELAAGAAAGPGDPAGPGAALARPPAAEDPAPDEQAAPDEQRAPDAGTAHDEQPAPDPASGTPTHPDSPQEEGSH